MNVRPWTGSAKAMAASSRLMKELEKRVDNAMREAREEFLPPGLLEALDTSDIEEQVKRPASNKTDAAAAEEAQTPEIDGENEDAAFEDEGPPSILRAALEGMVESRIQQGGMFAIGCQRSIVHGFAHLEATLWDYHLTELVLEMGDSQGDASPTNLLEWFARRKQAEVALHDARTGLKAAIEGATRAIKEFRSISDGDGGRIFMGGFSSF